MKNDAAAPFWGNRDKIINMLGIAFAFFVAFGGLILVRSLLMEEEESLLRSGGAIEVSPWMLEAEGQDSFEQEAERVALTEEELLQLARILESDAEVYLHEPLSGQMSMQEAIEQGREWLEDFLLPHMRAQEYIPSGYKISCYLMAPLEDGCESEVDRELFSYWMVGLYSQDVEADLVLNAVTGQVLEAQIQCFFPTEYMEDEELMGILEDYAHSLGSEGKYAMVGSKDFLSVVAGRLFFRQIGDTEVFAAIRTGNIAVSYSTAGRKEYRDVFYMRLYLNTNIY